MDFKKWLRKFSFEFSGGEQEEMIYCSEPEDSVISVRALGEWALVEVVDNGLLFTDVDWELENIRNHHKDKLLLQIAVSCLGKAEVEKRLKAVSY